MRTGMAAAVLGLGTFIAAPASAIVIELDFTHDTFFTGNTTARNTLLAAAADISNAITTNLNATVDTNSATFGSMSISYDHMLAYANPSNGSVVPVTNAALAPDVVKVYVGHRNLTGATLAEGGPGILLDIALNGSGGLSDLQGAVNAADVAATANLRRGGGPIIGTHSGVFELEDLGPEWDPSFSVSFGALMGHLWFDSDIDNNSFTDPGILNSGVWHYDHTTAPAAGKFDLYSIALHELLHTVGIGVSESWDNNVSGTNWLGAEVIELLGNGLNVLHAPEPDHIAENLMSRPLNNLGALQEVVMSPTIDLGERRYLTELDLAFLRDINWDTVVVPEPAAAMLLLAPLALLSRRGRQAKA